MFATNNSSSDMSLSNSDGSHWMPVSNEEMRLAATTPKKRAGRKKFKETRHPVYRGVRRRNNDKWVCEMREPNKKTKIWLGTFPTVEMAARAHDVAAMALRGCYACLNFADSVWRLPKPATAQAKDIQKAATLAAEAFRPKKTLLTNDNDMTVVVAAPEEQPMLCRDDMPELMSNMALMSSVHSLENSFYEEAELWRNMALMSPTHSLEYYDYEYVNEDFQDAEISLWNF
ncbi:dehydration-responsive element-binding protein 1E-like [Trifolium pratense]|uniref:dehydration-responsive element-binding protein 1E-like n=1 Tax=Trifolium pratense TaxID=57577 RepID=UPI001E6963A8|nr:dehydration-responsive element-binding protein 1E-like [Trifolium pratense]